MGFDIRRVHARYDWRDQCGGCVYIYGICDTESCDRGFVHSVFDDDLPVVPPSGSGFADFLFGLPQQSAIQAGTEKTYLRANVFDWYAQDDWRVQANLTLNYGLRYEYFSPYVEKYNRLVNLDHNANFTQVVPVLPGAVRELAAAGSPRSLVNPDRSYVFAAAGVCVSAEAEVLQGDGDSRWLRHQLQHGTVCDVLRSSWQLRSPFAIDADELSSDSLGLCDVRRYDAGEWVRLLDDAGAE